MTDPLRSAKLPSSITIQQTKLENASISTPEQKTTQVGIASVKDSIEAKQVNPLFTANSNTGEVKFGDGLSGKTPPSAQNTYQELSMRLKENRLSAQNKVIDAGMQEAGEKADAAREQAMNSLVTGIVSGSISIAGASSALKDYAAKFAGGLTENNTHADFESAAKKLMQSANRQDIATKRLENAASKDEDYAKSSQDHRDRIRNAILDFLRKLGDTNPQI